MSTRPPFPSVLDSTIMATAKACGQKANLEYLEHWKVKDQSVHLHAGASYASGLEAARRAFYEQGKSSSDSVAIGFQKLLEAYGDFACPPDSPKSAERMAGALEFYFSAYPLGQDKAVPLTLPGGKRGIELSFTEPIDIAHPETGDPLIYSGRLDMAVEYDGMHLGHDDKTTSSLGASWSRQWDLRSQFTGYTWGMKQQGIKLDGFLIRGVSILKTKYDTQQAITYRPQWMIDRWYEQLLRDVHRLMQQWESSVFDYNLDHSCAEYGGCVFREVCQMREPSQLLEVRFERRQWDPILRKETVL